jgi:KDO2-lipid IV(A) lauroyltransferase
MADVPLAAKAPRDRVAWRHRAEARLADVVFGAVRLLPLDRASALGGALARLIGPRLGVTKRARLNLRAAMPELGAAETEAVIRAMWDNLGRVMFEYPHLRQIQCFGPQSRVEILGVEHIDRSLAAGRQIILVAGHLGNWEIAPLAAEQHGMAVAHVYRAANNPLVDRMIARMRPDLLTQFLPKGAVASRRAVGAVREGMHLGMLIDQKMNDGIPVPFFGRDAMTAPALARLAMRYDLDIIPVRSERLDGARFRLTVHPKVEVPHSADRNADVAAVMAEVSALLESWIRDRPEQWLWLHRRWPE